MTFTTFITSLPGYLPLSTLLLLSTTSLVKRRVKTHGPNPAFPKITKLNSIVYSLFSLILCLALLYPIQIPTASEKSTWNALICHLPTKKLDQTSAKVFHYSKLYEYVDIINVLASGGSVNTHFWFHHLTTPYLTYIRVLTYPQGWKLFGMLNNFHHFLMYAYFGGWSVFSPLLPWTGYFQLIVGMVGEVYLLSDRCGGLEEKWPHCVGLTIYACYAVLFYGEVVNRGGKKDGAKKE